MASVGDAEGALQTSADQSPQSRRQLRVIQRQVSTQASNEQGLLSWERRHLGGTIAGGVPALQGQAAAYQVGR